MRVMKAVATLAVASLAACGQAAVEPSVTTSATPTAAHSPLPTPTSTPTAPPTPTPGPTPTPVVVNPAPPELAGAWQTTEGERITLSLLADRYAISRGPGSGRGKLAVRGSEIELFGSDLCVGSGLYGWEITSGILRLTPLGPPDPCANRLDAVVDRSFVKT